jgi:endonuclease YncB( thermonuclease family)/DNA polymerase III delta prime subunit
MQTFVTNAESLIKQSPNHPWRISLTSPSGDGFVKATIGTGGEAEMGPRLFEVLSTIEGRNKTYPYSIQWDILDDFEDEFTVKIMGDSLVYIELGIESYKNFLRRGSFLEGTITTSSRVMEYLPVDEEDTSHPHGAEEELFSMSAVGDELGSKQDYFIIGRLDAEADKGGVRDGDTIDIVIEALGSKVASSMPEGYATPTIGGRIGIRLVGIQTPETSDHSTDYGDDKNSEYALKFNLDTETVYKIGDESTEYARTTLVGDGYIVIDLDITSAGKIQTSYDRLMGVVYKTSTDNLESIQNGSAGSVINLNKSLLVEKSQEVEDVPLAILYEHFATNIEYSRFDVALWEYELGIKKGNENEKVGEVIDTIIEDVTKPDDPNPITTNPIEVRYADTSEYDNRLNWFRPYDDRMEEPELNLPVLSECTVRIGDVMLVIPPLSIQYNRASTSEKVKTLRTKQSTILRSGNTESTLSLQLYFHDLDSINGHEWENPNGLIYHMDGLRPLIAQFKKAPFVPIDNPYINDVLDIYDVALIDISVSTVPGFPNSLSATLRLAKFEITPFMPQIPGLGAAINYPMMRWYYQEAMKEHVSPLRTSLKPIDSANCGEFNFSIADETDLLRRQKAIEKLRVTATPEEIVEQVQNNESQFGRLINDAKAAEKIVGQYDRYIKAKNDKRILPFIDEMDKEVPYGQDKGISPTSLIDGGSDDGLEESLPDGVSGPPNYKIYNHKEVWNDIYENAGHISEPIQAGGYYAPWESAYWDASLVPIEVEEKYQIKAQAGSEEYLDENLNSIFWDSRLSGYIWIYLNTGSNIGMFPDEYRSGEAGKNGSQLMIIPGTVTNIEKIKKIVKAGKDAELGAQDDIDEYNELQKIAQWTEGNLPLYPYEIDGLICTSINVAYQNHFAGMNMPGLEGPTMQYLGGQDPQIQVTFEANEEAVYDLRVMLEEVDRYAREYRLGITSGFMGVENGLAGLFGIDSVIPEHVVVSTVPNFPGRFQVEMVLSGFNKTQRRSETLEGISPIYSTEGAVGDVNLTDRHYSNGDMTAQDNGVFEYRMRTLETYADLELPTYDELNAALPKVGADVLEYKNPTKTKFVDPDFYVATEWTMREDFRSERDKDQRMYFRDMVGVKMYTDSADPLPINGDAENWDLLRAVDAKTEKINPTYKKAQENGYTPDGALSYTPMSQSTEQPEEDTTGVASDVLEFVNDVEGQRVKPTYSEWASWGISKTPVPNDGAMSGAQLNAYKANVQKEYEAWLSNPSPTQVQIYDFIYKKVDALWKDYYYNDKDKTAENTTWYDIAYSKGSVDIFKANFKLITGEDPDSIIENGDPGGEDTKIAKSDWETFVKGKIPRERLANLIKATFHYLSQWRHYNGGGFPDQVGYKTNLQVGIGRLVVAKEAENKEEARRMMWDWKYNLEYAIDKMFTTYEKAASSSDNMKKAAPWDWMLHTWDDPDLTASSVDSDFFRGVYSRFEKSYNNYDLRFGTAQSPVEIDLIKRSQSITDRQMDILKGDRETLIEDLEAVGKNMDKYKNESKYGDAEIKEIYESHMFEIFGYHTPSTTGLANNAQKVVDNIENKKNQKKYPDEWANWKTYQLAMENIEYAKNAHDLVNYSDPKELYKGMFTDMLDYDHRGRLLRAFPTFQMFIIDEGRWMTDYRLWDNMYGFNAITSIDVHKNRKIVADTAIVKMTNVYSNLTQRPLSTNYGEWEYSWWSNLLFGNPSEELLDARKELLTGMLLQPGARIHLRMGYGSSVEHLPVVFNGSITEMDTDQVMTIVAQGDGIELTNVISGDPGDDNKSWGVVKEPRDTICNLMTSKGNWFKDAINYVSDGKFFRDNPLGIQHFGMPSGEKVPPGNLNWFNEEYGEVAQNIYSSNGANMFSQWVSGENVGEPFTWDGWMPEWNKNDEMNIKLNFYNKTVWDVISTIAMCSPDYIAAVHPFELRSTLFFGKPYYAMAYRYDAKYEYDKTSKQWIKYLENETRKPFMQFHWYGNETDIVSNKIKASSDNMFTNVIVTYDGGEQSPIAYADWDIRYDKQKTTVVEAPIMKQTFDFWTSEDQARLYSYSTVKEYMKDMYQGTLIVLGDPSLKPHDMCYLGDQLHDMTGNFQVKDVTHSFSLETGFISSITPDAVVVNDDMAFMNMTSWYASAAGAVLGRFVGLRLATKAANWMMGKAMAQKHIKAGTEYAQEYVKKSMHRLIKTLPKADPDVAEYKRGYRDWMKAVDSGDTAAKEAAIKKMESVIDKLTSDTKVDGWESQGLFDKKGSKFKTKRLLSLMKTGTKVMKDGKNAFFLFRAAGTSILGTNPIGWLVTIGTSVITETLAEMYRRKKANYQCVLMLPLRHQGREFTAGINGHKGMVVGDSPGKMDNFLAGAGWTDDPNAKDEDHFSLLIDTFDFLANAENVTIPAVTQEDLESGVYQNRMME